MNNNFLSKTYQYVMFSILLSSLGAYIGLQNSTIFMSTGVFIGLIILELATLLAFFFLYNKNGINTILYYLFSFLTGLTLVPLLMKAISINPDLILISLLLTAVAVGSFSYYAINTKRDFSGMGKYLFVTLVVLIVATITNIFLQLPILHIVISAVTVILFSFFLIYDTQSIIRGDYPTPMMAAINLYIDILNMFSGILSLLIHNDD